MKSLPITYWKNLNSGAIYKYYGNSKPLNWATEWKQVAGWDYDEAMRRAPKNISENNKKKC